VLVVSVKKGASLEVKKGGHQSAHVGLIGPQEEDFLLVADKEETLSALKTKNPTEKLKKKPAADADHGTKLRERSAKGAGCRTCAPRWTLRPIPVLLRAFRNYRAKG